ncbi:TRAP transporter small permease subunit [Microbulbifer sp. S227A]|uniref:TRAP transporter small permease subunit n=1 Tax=Microbulbifer sp. S227A TaxID=3415131 RepID=UPI003C7E5076
MRILFTTLERMIDRLGLLGSCAIIFVALLSVAEIFRRYVLVDPSIWSSELIVAVAAGAYVLAGPYALYKRRHIEITVFSDHFPRWLKSISELAKVLCGLVYIGALAYGAFDMASSAISGGETLGGAWDVPIPQVTKSVLFIACALFWLLLLGKLLGVLHAIFTGGTFERPVEDDLHD